MSSWILWEEQFSFIAVKEFFTRSNLMLFPMDFTLQACLLQRNFFPWDFFFYRAHLARRIWIHRNFSYGLLCMQFHRNFSLRSNLMENFLCSMTTMEPHDPSQQFLCFTCGTTRQHAIQISVLSIPVFNMAWHSIPTFCKSCEPNMIPIGLFPVGFDPMNQTASVGKFP
jgi:hypothetical protein